MAMQRKSSISMTDLIEYTKLYVKNPENDADWEGQDDEEKILLKLSGFFVACAHKTQRLNQGDLRKALAEVYNSSPFVLDCVSRKLARAFAHAIKPFGTTWARKVWEKRSDQNSTQKMMMIAWTEAGYIEPGIMSPEPSVSPEGPSSKRSRQSFDSEKSLSQCTGQSETEKAMNFWGTKERPKSAKLEPLSPETVMDSQDLPEEQESPRPQVPVPSSSWRAENSLTQARHIYKYCYISLYIYI